MDSGPSPPNPLRSALLSTATHPGRDSARKERSSGFTVSAITYTHRSAVPESLPRRPARPNPIGFAARSARAIVRQPTPGRPNTPTDNGARNLPTSSVNRRSPVDTAMRASSSVNARYPRTARWWHRGQEFASQYQEKATVGYQYRPRCGDTDVRGPPLTDACAGGCRFGELRIGRYPRCSAVLSSRDELPVTPVQSQRQSARGLGTPSGPAWAPRRGHARRG